MRFLLAALLLAACTSSQPQHTSQPASGPATGARTPAVPADSPNHDLFEGASFKNDCAEDSDCHAGGCSHEVCAAEEGVITSCIAHPDQPRDATCGCVNKVCIWYR